ncbi:MAG TPA: hypothetical protein VEZ40_14900 [Pyrinomonadaceae bacterium]|nr:hypothetical protein [Pyrinomonadaceae bacterium]
MRPYKTIARSILVTLVILGAFVPTAQEVAAQLPQMERELEDDLPKHLPLKIKVRNLKSEKWARDFEIEFTNTSDKPIYYLRMFVDLPDVKAEDGINLGFPLQYGRGALISFAVPIEPDDVPIKPGETYTWRIPEQLQLGWERFVKRRGLTKSEPKKIKFIFQSLNFGDGTGFRFTSARPFDIHKRRRELMQRESERVNSAATATPGEPRVRP